MSFGRFNIFIVLFAVLMACSAPPRNPQAKPQAPSADAIGLNAEYFADPNFAGPSRQQIDSRLNFYWGKVRPSKGVRPGSFSARWTGYIQAQYSEEYTFYLSAEGKAALYINEQFIAKDNKSGAVRLQAGTKYSIRVEYTKANDEAGLKLEWSSASQPRQVVPPTRFYPADASVTSASDGAGGVSAQAVPGGTELLLNGDFEQGTGMWVKYGSGTFAGVAPGRSGSGNAVKTVAWAYAEQVLPYAYVKPGVTYTLEAWAYTPNGAPCKVGLSGGGTNGSFDYPNLTFTSSAWEKKTTQITMPAGATWAVVYVNGTGSGSQECRFDDVSLHVGDLVAPTPPPAISGVNMLENPGFEQDLANWLLNGSSPTIVTSGHTGKAIQLNAWSWIQQKLVGAELQPSKEYVLRGWMRSAINEACLLGIEGATSTSTFEQSYTYRSPTWVEIYVRYTLPANTTWAGAFIAGPAGCQFDDLVMGIVATGGTSTTGTVGSSGGTVALGDAYLTVPPNLLTSNTQFKIDRLTEPPTPLPQSALISQTPSSQVVAVYRLSSSAAEFGDGISLVVPTENPPTTGDFVTELFTYDGTEYKKIRIGGASKTFAVYPNRLFAGQSDTGFSAGVTLVAVRASTNSLASVCSTNGGNFNGKYCELPYGVGPGLQAAENPIKILSFNVGNAIQSGSRMENFYCGKYPSPPYFYSFKLCSYAIEEEVRNQLFREEGTVLPSIIGFQELWNDNCKYVAVEEAQIQVQNPNVDNSDRVCVNIRPDRQIDRLLRSGLQVAYDYRCTTPHDFTNSNRVVNGYECIAIDRTKFEFVGTGDVLQPPCGTVSTTDYYKGSDTGSHFETVRPKNFLYRDPLTPSDMTRANQAVEFDVVNAHLIGALPTDDNCRTAQIEAIGNRYFNATSNRPETKRVLIMGDFNTDPTGSAQSIPNTRFRQQFADFGTALNALPPTNGWKRVGYVLSNPASTTTTFLLVPVAFDHIISNFADGTCGRRALVHGTDHKPTICALTGFDAGSGSSRTTYLEQEFDPVTGTVITLQKPELNFVSARRKGVLLTYVRLRGNDGNGLNTFVGLPSMFEVIVGLRRCSLSQPVADFEFSTLAEPGQQVPRVDKVYPAFQSCS